MGMAVHPRFCPQHRPGCTAVHVCCVNGCDPTRSSWWRGPCRLVEGVCPDCELRSEREGWGQAGRAEREACSALIVRQCTLFWAKCDFLGTGSEEWAVLSVTVTDAQMQLCLGPSFVLYLPKKLPTTQLAPTLPESCLWW